MDLAIYSFIIIVVALAIALSASKLTNKRIRWQSLLLYMCFTGMIGPIGEVFVGTIYNFIFSQPLWQYQVLAIHHGYTSLFAPFIWGMSGILLYISQEMVKPQRPRRMWHQALIIALETILAEVVINISFLLVSGSLLFYYTPGDLWHVTSLQTLPFYFIFGLMFIKTMARFSKDNRFYSLFCLMLLVVFVYFQ